LITLSAVAALAALANCSRHSGTGVHQSSCALLQKLDVWRPFMRPILRNSLHQLLCGAALLALSVPASAQNIDTTPQWDGANGITTWGVVDTATYGQTITPTSGQRVLSSFTFELGHTSGTPSQYQAFVYQWDSVNNRITGSALFSSAVFTAPSAAAFTPVKINTGGIVLSPGPAICAVSVDLEPAAAAKRELQIWTAHDHHRLCRRPVRLQQQRR
jgi:hypothetical protein